MGIARRIVQRSGFQYPWVRYGHGVSFGRGTGRIEKTGVVEPRFFLCLAGN